MKSDELMISLIELVHDQNIWSKVVNCSMTRMQTLRLTQSDSSGRRPDCRLTQQSPAAVNKSSVRRGDYLYNILLKSVLKV